MDPNQIITHLAPSQETIPAINYPQGLEDTGQFDYHSDSASEHAEAVGQGSNLDAIDEFMEGLEQHAGNDFNTNSTSAQVIPASQSFNPNIINPLPEGIQQLPNNSPHTNLSSVQAGTATLPETASSTENIDHILRGPGRPEQLPYPDFPTNWNTFNSYHHPSSSPHTPFNIFTEDTLPSPIPMPIAELTNPISTPNSLPSFNPVSPEILLDPSAGIQAADNTVLNTLAGSQQYATNLGVDAVKARFIIISDAGSLLGIDPLKSELQNVPADILIYCGGLTDSSFSFLDCMNELSQINVELILVIEGSNGIHHDDNGDQSCITPEHARSPPRREYAANIGTGAEAAKISYLDEGLHYFTLKNGAKFTIYSLYPSGDCGLPENIHRSRAGFNYSNFERTGVRKPDDVPEWPPVDIMISHCPPDDFFDTSHGLEKLFSVMNKAKPILYCFGKALDGNGAAFIRMPFDIAKTVKSNPWPRPLTVGLRRRDQEVLFTSAAIKRDDGSQAGLPWLVELDLPVHCPGS